MTTREIVPEGYGSVTPYFTVDDGDAFIAFLAKAFDGSVVQESRYKNGRIQHARVRLGTSIIMLNESTETYPANFSQMHVFLPDADATYSTALEAGAVSLMKPNDRPHGDRMAGVIDPLGNTWWIATHRG